MIRVTNPLDEETTFRVESDLPYVGGAADITLPPLGTADYTIGLNPQVGLGAWPRPT